MATNQNRASLIAASVGLSLIALMGSANAAPPPATAPSLAQVAEDDPAWDCLTMGNRMCGDPDGKYAKEAWAAWDKAQAWKHLRTAATNTRVEYVGYAKRHPDVDALSELAVPSRHGWFVFRGTLTTEPTTEGK